jgi:hypothetical protein
MIDMNQIIHQVLVTVGCFALASVVLGVILGIILIKVTKD